MSSEQETTQATAWRGQAQMHHLMIQAQRDVGHVVEANRLANAGNLAALIADELEQGGQPDQALKAYQRRLSAE